jgi:predicted O-methyltransferase YrrM
MEKIVYLLQPVVDYWLAADRFEKIEGYLEPIEGYALLLMAAYGPGTGSVVEIGSLYGKSTCYLAEGARKAGRGPVYAVDTFAGSAEHQAGQAGEQTELLREKTTFKAFLRNLAAMRLDEHVRPQVGTSAVIGAVWSEPIRLLFIDGNHTYAGSKQDFELWALHVVSGGLVVFHDIGTWEGVTQFYEELRGRAPGFKEVLSIATLRVLQREG